MQIITTTPFVSCPQARKSLALQTNFRPIQKSMGGEPREASSSQNS